MHGLSVPPAGLGRLAAAGLLTVCASLLVGCGSLPSDPNFARKNLTVDGQSQNYSVFIPHAYTPEKKWPVIVFLHGVLQAGSDGRECTKVGLGQYVDKHADTFPFIVVFPQSTGEWKGDAKAKIAIACLDQVQRDYSTDPDRVILTGLSNGGTGTWSVAARYPDRFSALVPMCAESDVEDVEKVKGLPIWCFHNSIDPFIGCGNTSEMCRRLKEAGANVKFTQYGTFGHDCWSQAYTEAELFDWMAGQRHPTLAGANPNTAVHAAAVNAANTAATTVRPPPPALKPTSPTLLKLQSE